MAGEPKPPLLAVVLTGNPSNPQQSQQKHNQQSKLTTDTKTLTSPPTSPLTSPPNNQHRHNNRNKGGKRKSYKNNNNNNRWILKKIQNLTEVFNPVPFVPKLLDLCKHEHVLKRLGLYKFSKLNLDKSIRTDLLVELIVSYNPKKKCSYVNGKRIRVNRADLARALELPVMKHDLEMDEAVFSDEEIGFIEDFVFNWVLLHEESWVMPVELENWTRCVRDGRPEKLDAASLVWYKVEKELSQGVKLGDCYYASHLQQLIRVQHGEVFTDVEGNVKEREKEEEETVSVGQEVDVELSLGVDVEKVVCRDVREDDETMVYAEECKEEVENDLGERSLRRCQSGDLETKVEKVVDEHDGKEEHEEKEEKVSIVQEDDVELTLEADFEKVVHRDVREDDEMMVDAEECKEEVELEVEKMEEQVNQKNDLGEHILQRGQSSDLEAKVEIVVDEHEHDHEEKEEQEETVSIVQEDSVELTLGADVRKIVYRDVREDGETMVNAEEWKEEVDVEKMEEQEKWKIDLDEQILQRCESSDLNSYEETKVEAIVDEQIEQVEEMEEQVNWKNGFGERVLLRCQGSDVNNYEDIKAEEVVDEQTKQVDEMEEQVYCKNVLGEHILQHCESSGLNNYEGSKVEEVVDEQIELVDDDDDDDDDKEEEECGDDDDERFVGGFDMEENDDIMDRDGLNDHIRYTSHGVSPIDLFGSRDVSFMSHGGPSFFGNAGKRVIQPEEDMHRLDGNSKRYKTNEMWDQKQNDFDSCMVQMQQWVEKAKVIQESKEASYANSKYHQDAVINQLQERNQIMENVIKSKDEQLAQKHVEVFRLERELYLMGDLVVGYRKALNDTRLKFAEYRKRIALQEEPLYKDAGPGGLVLSTRELERQRLKQEEYKMKIQTCLKSFEEECVNHLKILDERVLKMAEKLVLFGIEVKRLEEIAARCKETQKPRDELELSPEPEEKQKSYEEVLDNEASMESVHPNVDESKERGGGEEVYIPAFVTLSW